MLAANGEKLQNASCQSSVYVSSRPGERKSGRGAIFRLAQAARPVTGRPAEPIAAPRIIASSSRDGVPQ
jgi:hypothetical protein